jgi:hypothetical protein
MTTTTSYEYDRLRERAAADDGARLTSDDLIAMRASDDHVTFFKSEDDTRYMRVASKVARPGFSEQVLERLSTSYGAERLRWQTMVKAMRSGDRLRVEWIGNNTSPNMREHGWTADEASLVVERLVVHGNELIQSDWKDVARFSLAHWHGQVGHGSALSRMVRSAE